MTSRRFASFFLPPLTVTCLFAGAARAGTACAFSPQPLELSFGRLGVDNLQGAATTGRFSETCQPGLPTDHIGLCVRFGSNGGGRAMTDAAGHSIAYGLYHDPQMTIPWLGDAETLFQTGPYDRLGGGSIQQTLYAKILSSTAGLPQGNYSDEFVASAIVAGESGYDGASNVCLSGLASSETPRVRVVATLQASCTVTTTDMVFSGTLSPSSSISAKSAVNVVCTNGTPYELSLSAGAGAGATIAARKMTGPNGQTIGYSLFRDAAHALIWGDVAGFQLSGVGVGGLQTLSVYGLAPAQTTPAAGRYVDTINVTLTY